MPAARLLMDHLEIDQLDRITLAGAFGSHIDVKYAMVLGMIPDCDLSKVGSAGNAAGTGARIALLNMKSRGRDRPGGASRSRRSRPRWSRNSRSTSSKPWRFRTKPVPTRIFPPLCACQRPRMCCRLVTMKGARAGVVDAAKPLPGGDDGHDRQEGRSQERSCE